MTLNAIEKWQQTARPANEEDVSLALGIFLEEVAEVLAEFQMGESQREDTIHYFEWFKDTAENVSTISDRLKCGVFTVQLPRDNRANCVKELADVIVTAVGVGHALNLDVPTACERVNTSNLSKFVDGKPLHDAHGKVIKGPHYVKADVTGLTGEIE